MCCPWRALDGFNGVHDHDESDSGRHAHSFLSLLRKTVNYATVVCPSLPRKCRPRTVACRARICFKKPQDSSTYGRVAFCPPRSDSWRA